MDDERVVRSRAPPVGVRPVVLVEEPVARRRRRRRPPAPGRPASSGRGGAWPGASRGPAWTVSHGPVEHDLQAGQLLVAEVLGLVPQPPRLLLASSRIRWATWLAWRTISVRETMRSAWARTSSRRASASRWRARPGTRRARAAASGPGAARRAGARGPRSSSSSTSSRATSTEADSGMALAVRHDVDRPAEQALGARRSAPAGGSSSASVGRRRRSLRRLAGANFSCSRRRRPPWARRPTRRRRSGRPRAAGARPRTSGSSWSG